jgi:nitrogen fixation NifU-like protein
MDELRDLYQEVIVDHGRQPRNFGHLAGANRSAEGFNPLCGDRLTLYLRVEDGIIRAARFDGAGCAISTASASLMTELLRGKSEAEAAALFAAFHTLVTDGRADAGLGKLAVLAGVREFPSRIKCATLAWHTLHAALAGAQRPTSTE